VKTPKPLRLKVRHALPSERPKPASVLIRKHFLSLLRFSDAVLRTSHRVSNLFF
jgi:hypothetical protein